MTTRGGDGGLAVSNRRFAFAFGVISDFFVALSLVLEGGGVDAFLVEALPFERFLRTESNDDTDDESTSMSAESWVPVLQSGHCQSVGVSVLETSWSSSHAQTVSQYRPQKVHWRRDSSVLLQM